MEPNSGIKLIFSHKLGNIDDRIYDRVWTLRKNKKIANLGINKLFNPKFFSGSKLNSTKKISYQDIHGTRFGIMWMLILLLPRYINQMWHPIWNTFLVLPHNLK